jgi:plastocyanin
MRYGVGRVPSRRVRVPWRRGVLLAALWLPAGGLAGQSTLERSPNVEGLWAGRAGVLHFNFHHRFQITDPPLSKVLNSPTFLLAAGLPWNVTAGSRYTTNSQLVSGDVNEWELFARWVPLRQERRAPLDVGIQLSHNGTAGGVDGELLVGRTAGPLRLMLGGRAFSAFRGGDAAGAVVAAGALRLHRFVALAADVAEVLGEDGGETAWSGGLQLAIPYSPHYLSLHVTNVNAVTLQGATVGTVDRRWGFEFTVPLTLSRYAGDRSAQPAAGAPVVPGETPVGATVDMDNRMNFLPDTVRIAVGESVVWRNGSDIVHTVTADPARAELPGSVRLPPNARPFDSGDMRPGEEFTHVFLEPGEYRYFCVPHERAGMVGVVIVD